MSQQKKYVSLSKLETYHDKLTEQIDAELQEFASEVNQAIDILSGEIDSKANATHNHKISDVTNLQNTLDSNLESANAYTDETTNALSEGFSTVIMQMYGTDVTEDGAPTIRQIAYDEANKVQTNLDALDGNFDAHLAAQNPHGISKATIGLGNVNNTSDMDKPVSTAQQTAINAALKAGNDAQADIDAHIAASNPHEIKASTIGLGNVNNTADADKPVSTAQAAAIKVVQDDVDTVSAQFNDHKNNGDIHFTATERTKLSGIEAGANKYTHPNSGVTASTYKSVTVNAQGHVTGGSNPTTLAGYGITDAEAKGTVNTHNNSDVAHSDIRGDIAELAEKVANFLDVDDTTVDQLSEVIRLINENHDSLDGLIDGLALSKVNVSDIINNLTTNVANKPLSAAQGVALKALIDGITKSSLGLGNVDNTADADKTVKAAGTATTATTLSGLTATIAELNYVDGVTSSIQTQLNNKASKDVATQSANGLMAASDKEKLDDIEAGANKYTHPDTHAASMITGLASVATSGSYTDLSNKPAIPTVYTAVQCTTYTSDSGTVTPLAVQNAAKKFAIPRITSVDNAIAKFNGTTGEVQNSGVIIEDVVNTKDNSHAEVIAIPASGGKKMVYGYCTDQVDGTSFLGGLFDADATEFPYASGLAIGGSSGNLLWKGLRVATVPDIPTKLSQLTNDSGFKTTDNNTTYTISKSGSTVTLTGSDGSTSTFTDANTTYTPAALGSGYGTCSTAAATVAKVVTLSNYALTTGGIVSVKFTNAVPTGATMNINSKGAKPIYYRGKAIVDGVICAGEVGVFVYDGSYYHLIAVDRNRFYTSLVPYGTSIEASETATVNLNTPDYMKVGNYFCSSNAKAKYVSNIPKANTAFMMQVYSPLSQTVDNEAGTWVYRLRKIIYYTGEEYTQYCYTDGTGGNWQYGPWKKFIVDTDTATTSKAGLMSAADKTKLDGLQSGGGFDFDALIDASGYSYSYVKSTGVETLTKSGSTYATRTSTKNASTGVWTVVTVCSAAGVNVTKTYTPTSTGWTVA